MPESLSHTDILKIGRKLGDLPQIQHTTLHHFGKGVYVREFRQPAHSIVVGKIHRYDHVFMITAGEVTVISPDGHERIRAPYVRESHGMIERVVIAHTDVTFLTAHKNPWDYGLADLAVLEHLLFLHPEDSIIEGHCEQVPPV